MSSSGAEQIRLSSLMIIVALVDNDFNVKAAARQLDIKPGNVSAVITKLISSSSVEIFKYNLGVTGIRSQTIGLTSNGWRIYRAARELLKELKLLEISL